MRISEHLITETTIKEYVVEVDGKFYHYKDYYNSKGKVIDSELSDGEGNLIRDDELIERIQKYIDEEEL